MRGFRAVLGLVAGTVFAFAPTSASADGPAGRGSRDAPVAYAPFSWSGLYAGVHAGYAWADTDVVLDYSPVLSLSGPTNNDGAIVGGHIGLQHQFGRWVVGGELALSAGFDSDTVRDLPLFGGVPVGTVKTDMDWLLTATLRLGYSWDRWLGYMKGGYAGAVVRLSTDDNVPPDWVSSTRDMYHGWTVGAGLEYALAPDVIVGVEYNYVDLSGDASTALFQQNNGAFIRTIHMLHEVLSPPQGEGSRSGSLKRWLYGTASVLPSTWRSDAAALRESLRSARNSDKN